MIWQGHAEKVRLARAGEQPGFYGLGKYEADIYFLDIRRRAAMLKKNLKKRKQGGICTGTSEQRSACRQYRLSATLPPAKLHCSTR